MTDNPVYMHLTEYQRGGPAGWALQDVMKQLHDWASNSR